MAERPGRPPAAADAAGVSGGHQNGGCLLRRASAGERPPAAAGGGAQPDPGFPGAGRAGEPPCCASGCWAGCWRIFTPASRGDENARLLAETLGAGRDDRALEAWCWTCTRRPKPPHPPAVAGGAEAGLGQNAGAPAGHRLRPVSHGGRPAEGGLLVPAADPGRGGHGGLPRRVQKPTATGSWRQPRPWNTCGTRRNRAGTAWDRRSPYSAGWEPSGAMKTPPAGTGPRRCWSSAKRR